MTLLASKVVLEGAVHDLVSKGHTKGFITIILWEEVFRSSCS